MTSTPPSPEATRQPTSAAGLRAAQGSAIRYRRKRSAKVLGYSSWNFSAEEGDLMVCPHSGRLVRLEESSGWGKSRAGELYPRTIKPPVKSARAEIRDMNGTPEVFWILPNVKVSDPATP